MKVITKNAYFEQNIQKSRFLAFSYSVSTEEEALNIIKQIENKYCDCRHVVYAYKIEPNIEKKGNSSEPAGTAGAPIFACIEKNNLTNVLIVVVRYFGGVLLGATNLYRAYSSSASSVIDLSEVKEMQEYFACTITCDYSLYNNLVSLSQKYSDLIILSTEYNQDIKVKIAFKNAEKYKILQSILQIQKPKMEQIWL